MAIRKLQIIKVKHKYNLYHGQMYFVLSIQYTEI
jgi:hypothetical protein